MTLVKGQGLLLLQKELGLVIDKEIILWLESQTRCHQINCQQMLMLYSTIYP